MKVIDRVGTQAIYRMNHLIPPFNNAKARQALLYATGDQKDYLASMIGFAEYERPCWAVSCAARHSRTQAGVGAWAKGDKKANIEMAKQLLKEAGYKGEKVVILDPVEAQLAHSQAVVTAQKLREIGMNVDPAGDRLGHAERAAPDQGSARQEPRRMEHLPHVGRRPRDEQPAVQYTHAQPVRWQELVRLAVRRGAREDRLEFPLAPPEKQKEIVERLQKRFYEVVPYIPAGQFFAPIAFRKNLSGIPRYAAARPLEHREEVSGERSGSGAASRIAHCREPDRAA